MEGGSVDSEGQSLGMGAESVGRDSGSDEVVDPWRIEAEEKKLPEEFVERLAASDGVTEEEKARIVRSVQTAGDLAEKRKKAVEYGRALGTHEADSRRETGHDKDQRIKRAMAYAAWEFDGKPQSSKSQREEMGVLDADVTPSLQRVLATAPKPDLK